MTALKDCDSLDGFAEATVALECLDTNVATTARALADLTAQKFDAEQQAMRATAQVQAMKSDQAKATAQLKELKRDEFQPRPNLPELTAEWSRNTKQLKAKIGEYDDRLAGLRASQQPAVTLEDVTSLAKDLPTQQQAVRT